MFKQLVTISLALTLGACGQAAVTDNKTPIAANPASPVNSVTSPTLAPDAAAKPTLSCDKLIPQAMRDKFFAGAKIEEKNAAPGQVSCTSLKIDGGNIELTMLSYVCTDWSEATFKETMERGKKSLTDVKDLSGVGRMAYSGQAKKTTMVQLWDDDTNCYATITGKSPEELGKEAAAALTPAALQ
jgi:hypothetical protein